MSYILEALKKAQAERQLGSAPTIHAVPIQPMADQRERGRSKALLIGLGVVGLALAGAAAWWNQRTPQTPVPGAVVLPAAGSVAPQLAAAPAPATLPPAELDTAGIAGTAPVPVAGRSAVVAAPAASVPMSAQRAAPPVPPPAAVRTPVPAPVKTAAAARPAPVKTPAAAPLADARAPEESLPLASQLPESQRAGLPQLTFGGYMYSKNPADRLLLIDKVLRREGEEIAPGLVLERLLPRSAVLNHRGVRYRVPY